MSLLRKSSRLQMSSNIQQQVYRYLKLSVVSLIATVAVDECVNGLTIRRFVKRQFNFAKSAPVVNELPSVVWTLGSVDMAMHMNGIRHPQLTPSCDVQLPDQTIVIGVVVDNQPRAYVVEAMSSPATHVVNDIVGTMPVTVTYCDRVDCARVLTKSKQTEPLDINVAGFHSGSMELEIKGEVFSQNATTLPYEDLSFSRMTWGEWKAEYPDSYVFVGKAVD